MIWVYLCGEMDVKVLATTSSMELADTFCLSKLYFGLESEFIGKFKITERNRE